MCTRPIYCGSLIVVSLTAFAAERISIPLRNSAGLGGSSTPSVSANGRFVAFESTARLTADDTNSRTDVYVYDRLEETTRLASDDRGGDQPVISANGRFVAYRSLEAGLTRIRVRDLERGGVPLTASYPIDTFSYDRTAELAAISPEGRYVAYIFRRAPNVDEDYPGTLGNQIVVADTVDRNALRVKFRTATPGDNGESTNNIGRIALSADGNTVAFDTIDPLLPDDTNGASDVYRATVNTLSLQRLSKASEVPDLGGATQPVMALDGNSVFFVSQNPLLTTDTDGLASIYSNNSANNFAVPKLLATNSPAASLAAQATTSGRFLAYVNNKGRAFIHNVNTDVSLPLEAKANAPLLGPVISGNDRLAAFASKASNLVKKDKPSSLDVFAASTPEDPGERTAPEASVSLSNGSSVVPEGTAITIGASAASGSGIQKLLTVEVNGREAFRTTSSNLAPQNFTTTRGVHDVRARAFNDAWIEGTSALTPLIVVPPNGQLGITGTTSLERSDANDGSATFNASLRIDNRRAGPTLPLQVVVTITSLPQIMAFTQGDYALVPNRGESILTVINIPALAGMSSTTVSFGGITPPTEIFGNNQFQGNGWTVLAQLREQSGANFADVEAPATILTTYPRLNENTNLPNTGIPVVGPPNGSGFDSGLLQSITINGPDNVAEGSGASFRALAIFSNGSQACAPTWSLIGPNANRATIDSMGRLAAGSVSAPTNITVRAEFGAATATKTLTIKPTSPVITVSAPDAAATESGDPGQFRLLRTGSNKEELAVNYSISGKAAAGVDYVALNGIATFSAGASSVVLDVTPQQDAAFEGSENVILSLEPGAGYRLKSKRTATIEISDDEPFPANQPDLTIRRGKGPTIGSLVVDSDAEEITQQILANAKRGKPVDFTISLINRGNSLRSYYLRGGAAATGFTIQYVDGTADVTETMIAGYFVVSLDPGAARELTLRVTPTDQTPIGASLSTVIQAESESTIDAVSTNVERVK